MSLITLEKPSTSQTIAWPQLHALRLGAEAADARANGIGGSDANVILSGDAERIRELWLEKRGEAGLAGPQ